MTFTPNSIFHIYNQGNNRERIFFRDENYLYFLRKMRVYLMPNGQLLCYCLMPNHFHWLFYVEQLSVLIPAEENTRDIPVTKERTLNDAIAILLRSYTQAVNKQENRSGSLFRKHTKAKDGWEDPNLPPWHPQYALVLKNWELYGATCFQYIHNNPVKAGLVAEETQWPWSSAPDYAGIRDGTLCNQKLAKTLLQLP
jgi:putative transposase